MKNEDFGLLLALEPTWNVSINGAEFLRLKSEEIRLSGDSLRFGRFSRRVLDVRYLRPNVVRLRSRARLRSRVDVLVFYAGESLPAGAELRRRRRTFLQQLSPRAVEYFGARIVRQTLYSDKQHGIGGAYARLLVGAKDAVIAVDPDESQAVINGIMRAAIQWSSVVKRRISVVVPSRREQTIATRLRAMPALHNRFRWLVWDGETLSPMAWETAEVETHVQPYSPPDVRAEVARLCALAPALLQAVPYVPGNAVSIKLRGLEIARVSERGTTYPLGEPIEPLIQSLDRDRRHGSAHPLAHAHEEAWLESNLIRRIRRLLPVREDHVYPQVPSFAGEERKIIDLLTVTDEGRLAVIEIKASSDPDLPLQALDYWLAVERHRKAGDFERNGYFRNVTIRDEPALLLMVAPLLTFHRSMERIMALLPPRVPVMRIGVNQGWKEEIKILRRKGLLG